MARWLAGPVGWLRTQAEDHIHFLIRSHSGGEGFAMFGAYSPRHYLSRLYLGAREHGLSTRLHGTDVQDLAWNLLRQYGLVVFSGALPPGPLAAATIDFPGMVDLTVPLPPSDSQLSLPARSARDDVRRIRRAAFRFDVVTGDDWVDEFARRFHAPAMAVRHGTERIVASVSRLRQDSHAEGAEFLRIYLHDQWVGGALNRVTPDGYRLQKIGWRHGDGRLLRGGTVPAIYWFSLTRAAELGIRTVLLGSVRPDLEDGLLFFKSKWGARLQPLTHQYGRFSLLIDPAHDTCRRFLQRHSLIIRGRDGNAIVYSAKRPTDSKLPPEFLEGIRRWYRWLEQPSDAGGSLPDDVPARLHRWLVEEPLLSSS